MVERYNPNQPRDPGGEGGGQWISGTASGEDTAKLTEDEQKEFIHFWVTADWRDLQAAARAVVQGQTQDEYAKGNEYAAEYYYFAKRALNTIDASADVDVPLYRGLRGGLENLKVGDTFSESFSSWSEKQMIALQFATEDMGAQPPAHAAPTVISLAQSPNSKGIEVGTRYNADAEWITSGRYKVVKVAPDPDYEGVNRISVERIGPAAEEDLRRGFDLSVERFNPNQPRDPGGEGGGQWVKDPAADDSKPKPKKPFSFEIKIEDSLDESVKEWVVGDWTKVQAAARAIINGQTEEQYVAEAGKKYGQPFAREDYRQARTLLTEANRSPEVGKTLYRGLMSGGDLKVGDTFSESITSWTGKKQLASEFAAGHYLDPTNEPGPPAVLHFAQSHNSRGIDASSRLPSHLNKELRESDEWLTSGRYEVTAVERVGDHNEVTVKRIGDPKPEDLRKAAPSQQETPMEVIHKTATAEPSGLDYVLSDASVDRYGDMVDPSGWVLESFKRNPIALFNHDVNAPIGRWENLRATSTGLVGKLVLAAEGTSARIDELRRLIEQGILRAVSVGFKPLKEPERLSRGVRYRAQELLECSLVSVPANPNALQVARSLNISDDTVRLVFGKHATEGQQRRSVITGKHAQESTPSQRAGAMNLSEMITRSQERLADLRNELETHINAAGQTPDDSDIDAQGEIQRQIDEEDRKLKNWQQAEARLASTATSIEPNGERGERRPFALPAKKVEPIDYMFRALTVMVKHHGQKNQDSLTGVLKQSYGDDVATKAVLDSVCKAATVPATTTGPGWADTLVQTAIGDFIDALMPLAVYPGLAGRGARLTFGRNGRVSLPARNPTPSVGGSFVGQGAPIPVRQAAFSAVALTPKKMGVITTMTREIMEHSTPAIEQILRTAILEDTAIAVDSVLLDANPADAIRPAGVRNGVTPTPPTAGGGFNALVGDAKALLGSLLAGSAGQLRSPVWIMNPVQALSISLTQNNGGDFPFAAEINNGTFRGYSVIQSSTVPVGMVILMDAADFFSATGDDPRFDVSDQAVLHMEDTNPLQLGTTGTPATVAAPARSLWQTDTLGIRMLLDINWAFRRPGTVAVVEGVTW